MIKINKIAEEAPVPVDLSYGDAIKVTYDNGEDFYILAQCANGMLILLNPDIVKEKIFNRMQDALIPTNGLTTVSILPQLKERFKLGQPVSVEKVDYDLTITFK